MTNDTIIRFDNVTKSYNSNTTVLKGVSFELQRGKFYTLLGPSGCGKTTILRIIAGFETPSTGDVYIDDKRVNDIPANERQVNTVFQDYALFPHLNVLENVVFGLKNSSYERKVSLYGKEKLEENIIKFIEHFNHERNSW